MPIRFNPCQPCCTTPVTETPPPVPGGSCPGAGTLYVPDADIDIINPNPFAAVPGAEHLNYAAPPGVTTQLDYDLSTFGAGSNAWSSITDWYSHNLCLIDNVSGLPKPTYDGVYGPYIAAGGIPNWQLGCYYGSGVLMKKLTKPPLSGFYLDVSCAFGFSHASISANTTFGVFISTGRGLQSQGSPSTRCNAQCPDYLGCPSTITQPRCQAWSAFSTEPNPNNYYGYRLIIRDSGLGDGTFHIHYFMSGVTSQRLFEYAATLDFSSELWVGVRTKVDVLNVSPGVPSFLQVDRLTVKTN